MHLKVTWVQLREILKAREVISKNQQAKDYINPLD